MAGQKAKYYELMAQANQMIMQERYRQNEKWGVQRHNLGEWLGILMEEVGEFAQAVNAHHFPNDAKPTDMTNKLVEIIQVGAVAQAIGEQMIEELQAQEENQ